MNQILHAEFRVAQPAAQTEAGLNQFAEANHRIAEANNRIAEANARLAEAEARIAAANVQIAEYTAHIAEIRARIAELQAEQDRRLLNRIARAGSEKCYSKHESNRSSWIERSVPLKMRN
jgi:chromosome segregation ATPase